MKNNHIVSLTVLLTLSTTLYAQSGNNEALLDANTASVSELREAASLNEDVADAVEAGRPYLNALQLEAVMTALLDDGERETAYGQVFRQINLNTASRVEIMLIPGMSPKMAHEFEEYRPYTSLQQFRREMGKYVDEDEVARLEQYVFIPLNLNTASSDDLMTIPGMSSKMVHEFEEYRPYQDIEQFRREIGKYVDEDEVARLESYVTLE